MRVVSDMTADIRIDIKLPRRIVADVDRLAALEMISRSAWARRAILRALRAEQCQPEQPENST